MWRPSQPGAFAISDPRGGRGQGPGTKQKEAPGLDTARGVPVWAHGPCRPVLNSTQGDIGLPSGHPPSLALRAAGETATHMARQGAIVCPASARPSPRQAKLAICADAEQSAGHTDKSPVFLWGRGGPATSPTGDEAHPAPEQVHGCSWCPSPQLGQDRAAQGQLDDSNPRGDVPPTRSLLSQTQQPPEITQKTKDENRGLGMTVAAQWPVTLTSYDSDNHCRRRLA